VPWPFASPGCLLGALTADALFLVVLTLAPHVGVLHP
jgi:hypothetical protein